MHIPESSHVCELRVPRFGFRIQGGRLLMVATPHIPEGVVDIQQMIICLRDPPAMVWRIGLGGIRGLPVEVRSGDPRSTEHAAHCFEQWKQEECFSFPTRGKLCHAQ